MTCGTTAPRHRPHSRPGRRDDPATPPAHARELADTIPGAALTEIPHAAHLVTVDRPGALTGRAAGSLHARRRRNGRTPRGARRRARGPGRGRHDGVHAPFQDFITRYAWDEIWTRPGLDRRARSCVALTALVAGGHHEELALHVRTTLRNGLTPEEIGEVLLQTAVHCGVPAANAAFSVADRVLRED